MVEIKGLRGEDGAFGAVGVIEVPLGASCARDVWQFVADVELQPEWNQSVKACEVLESDGHERSIHQVLQWNFLALRGDMHFYLQQTEDPEALEIRTRMTRGTMMHAFRSRVTVRESTDEFCELEMEMYMLPAIFVPFAIRPLVGMQVRRQLNSVMTALHAALCERAGVPASGAPSSAPASISHPSDDLEGLSFSDDDLDFEDCDASEVIAAAAAVKGGVYEAPALDAGARDQGCAAAAFVAA